MLRNRPIKPLTGDSDRPTRAVRPSRYCVGREAATLSETYADLNPDRWQALCCPDCGQKLETVFVAPDQLQ